MLSREDLGKVDPILRLAKLQYSKGNKRRSPRAVLEIRRYFWSRYSLALSVFNN